MTPTVFLIDDDPDIRDLIEIALAGTSLRLITFDSGTDALQSMESVRPDLILLDHRMPGLSGQQVMDALTGKAVDTPRVAFLTASTTPAEVATFRDMGAVDVIRKPFDISALPDRILKLCQQPPA